MIAVMKVATIAHGLRKTIGGPLFPRRRPPAAQLAATVTRGKGACAEAEIWSLSHGGTKQAVFTVPCYLWSCRALDRSAAWASRSLRGVSPQRASISLRMEVVSYVV